MTSSRVDALADILVQHSTEIKQGDLVLIDGTEAAVYYTHLRAHEP